MGVECKRKKVEAVLVMGKNPKDVGEDDEVGVVGQEYLSILLALDRMELVVEQMQIIVDHTVFGSQPGVYRDCWLIIQLIASSNLSHRELLRVANPEKA